MTTSENAPLMSADEQSESGCPVILLGGNSLYRKALQSTLDSHLRSKGDTSFLFREISGTDEVSLVDLSESQWRSAIIIFFDEGNEFSHMKSSIGQLKRMFDPVKIILISENKNRMYICRCIEIGICAYILPDISEENLVDCIKVVAGGQMVFPSVLYSYGMDGRQSRAEPDRELGRIIAAPLIDEKEARVLGCLAAGMSNKEISRLMQLSEPAAKLAVRKLLIKVGAKNRVQGAVWAKQNGYALDMSPV